MKDVVKVIVTLGLLLAVVFSFGTIPPDRIGTEAGPVQLAGPAARDARCTPRPVKFPCITEKG